jgi:hypothetical protein
VYTINASSDNMDIDIDGQANISTLQWCTPAASTAITVDSLPHFLLQGNILTEIRLVLAELLQLHSQACQQWRIVSGRHADNTVVSSMNRYLNVQNKRI